MDKSKDKIDFVIIWCDPNDLEWQKKKARYLSEHTGEPVDASPQRYRDWDNLKYWFRAVETYAPWVRKVHFVSDGQVPSWLDTNYEKLNIVCHKDYIEPQALPVYNSCAIEMGLHRIEGLAEQFVYFNDDMFLCSPVLPENFFKNGLPVDMAGLTRENSNNTTTGRSWNYHCEVLNRFFDKKSVIKNNKKGWLRLEYGKTFLRTILNLKGKDIQGIVIPHLSTPFLRNDFEIVWNCIEEELNRTEHQRFRSDKDLSQTIFRAWRLCEGRFYPAKSKGKYFAVNNMHCINEVSDAIINQKYSEICINDCWTGEDFEEAKEKINMSFEKAFPNKSAFEK